MAEVPVEKTRMVRRQPSREFMPRIERNTSSKSLTKPRLSVKMERELPVTNICHILD